MPYDDQRRELFDLLEGPLGARGASLLMAQIPPVGWADLATKTDIAALRSELKGEMAEVRGEMAEVRGEMAEVRGEIAQLRADLKGDIAVLRGEVAAQVPKLWAANVASVVAVSGLVFAVASTAG